MASLQSWVVEEDTAPVGAWDKADIAGEKAIAAWDMAFGLGAGSMEAAGVVRNAGRRRRDCEGPATEVDHAVGIDDTLDACATDVVSKRWRAFETRAVHGDSCCRRTRMARSARVEWTTVADREYYG